jgi:hypothetical protein
MDHGIQGWVLTWTSGGLGDSNTTSSSTSTGSIILSQLEHIHLLPNY